MPTIEKLKKHNLQEAHWKYSDGTKNVEHLNEDERKQLDDLMPYFPEIAKVTVEGYKNMEVALEIDKNKNLYYTRPYRIPVLQITLIKRAINIMVQHKTYFLVYIKDTLVINKGSYKQQLQAVKKVLFKLIVTHV